MIDVKTLNIKSAGEYAVELTVPALEVGKKYEVKSLVWNGVEPLHSDNYSISVVTEE